MLKEFLQNEIVSLKLKVNLLKLAVIVIGMSNIIFGFLAYRAVQGKQVVFYPVGYCEQFVAGSGAPTPQYILIMTKFIAHSLFTYTPQTIRKQYESVLVLFAPEFQNKYKKVFEDFVSAAETAKISSTLNIEKIEHDSLKHEVHVLGNRIEFLEGEVVGKETCKFVFKYQYRYGTFSIISYRQIK